MNTKEVRDRKRDGGRSMQENMKLRKKKRKLKILNIPKRGK